jgi:catechol 2,3-dioxygenase-like lactoylglutathione lyase family enzyme
MRKNARRPKRMAKEKNGAGLAGMDVVAFVPTTNPARARKFFEATLGLKLLSEDPFALVFDANGTMLRVANVSSVKDYKPASFTILGWAVDDIDATVAKLSERGLQFERYAGMQQDEHGVWTSPSGARIAWFKDPDGNVLSLTEH